MQARADRMTVWRGLFVVVLVGVLVLALIPGGKGPDWFAHADKVRHAAAFITLWTIGRHAGLKPTWALALGLLCFGIGIELVQSLTPTRESSVGDVLADALGIAAGRWLVGAGL
ncbi:MAG TPA: VanZ family protein [Ideonella sp.]|jgi:VanZ family protein|nr:VanZ family protein [Ideonella sp.]